jgi:hypothetical protein
MPKEAASLGGLSALAVGAALSTMPRDFDLDQRSGAH